MKSKKLPSIKSMIPVLDDVFQMYIRYRDNFTCISCGCKYLVGDKLNFHAGHYISRGIYATRWDEENVNGQCRVCNGKQNWGDMETIYRYTMNIKQKYDSQVVDRLLQKKHSVFKLNRGFLVDNILLYYKELKNKYEKSGIKSTACEETLKKAEKMLKKCNFLLDIS